MIAVWRINGTTLEALGLSFAGISFRAQGPSFASFRRDGDFNAAEALPFGTSITLTKDAATIFQGKVNSAPKIASGSEEAQLIEVTDAWEDLERTIYMEEWLTGAAPATAMVPRAVLGIAKDGFGVWAAATVGTMIEAILDYAIGEAGIDIQKGAIPAGETMIPSEVSNSTCAELIRECLKLHPDWIPYLDHTTTPPTFAIAASGSPDEETGIATFDLTGGDIADFRIIHRTDMRPDCVRIVYELAADVDGEVYRTTIIDKYPAGAADAGPRVISATIPLAGLQMQTQKSRVQVRPLPQDQTTAKAWLKAKFPQLAAIADANLFVSTWTLALVAEAAGDFPDPISARAPRLAFTNVAEVTGELVRGTIEDWMRKHVGKVLVTFNVKGRPTLPQADLDTIDRLPESIVITGTDAVTKTYTGISQWIAPEDVPTGIAQATYEAIIAAMSWEGHITLVDEDVGATPYHGRVINLTNGPAGSGTMNAPVHTVDLDVATGTTRIGFGPHPYLAPADFLELQRILRYRPTRWWSYDERGSSQIGDPDEPSAAGDTVAPFETPQTQPEPRKKPVAQFEISRPFYDSGTTAWSVAVKGGRVLTIDPTPGTVMAYIAAADQTLTVTAASKIYCKVETDKNDLATAATIIVSAVAVTDIHAQPDPGGATGVYHYLLADFTTVGGNVELATRYHEGGPITHRPARNNRNLKITIEHFKEDSGTLSSDGSDTYLFWRRGLYVGTTDPGDGATQDTVTIAEITTVS